MTVPCSLVLLVVLRSGAVSIYANSLIRTGRFSASERYPASTSAMVFTLSATESTGCVPDLNAYCNCSITPMNAWGNHSVFQVGVTHAPPVSIVEAYVTVDGVPSGHPIVPL